MNRNHRESIATMADRSPREPTRRPPAEASNFHIKWQMRPPLHRLRKYGGITVGARGGFPEEKYFGEDVESCRRPSCRASLL